MYPKEAAVQFPRIVVCKHQWQLDKDAWLGEEAGRGLAMGDIDSSELKLSLSVPLVVSCRAYVNKIYIRYRVHCTLTL